MRISNPRHLNPRHLALVAALLLGGVAFADQTPPPNGATAGGATAPAKDVSACASRDGQLLAHYVIYGREGEHFAFEGPELMTRSEANARRVLLESHAKTKHGADARVTFGVVDKAGDCSFVYRDKAGKKYSLAQGSQAYVDKRRDELVRWNYGTPSSPTVCLAPAAGGDRTWGDGRLPGYARVYGLNPDATCAAAKRCLAEDAIKKSLGKPVGEECSCESVAGGMSSCEVKAIMSKDTPFGIRG